MSEKNSAPMTDISAIQPSERVIEILHPGSGENFGIRVNIMSITDPRLKKIKRNIQDRKLALQRKGKDFKADDIENNEFALAFEAMTGWEWYAAPVGLNGEAKPAFTRENVFEVFRRVEWFLKQIVDEISDEKEFF